MNCLAPKCALHYLAMHRNQHPRIARTCRIIKEFCDGLNLTEVAPACAVHLAFITVGRDTVFKTLSAVFQDVFTDTTKVEIQISTVRSVVVFIEGVHHPELNELNILLFKIVDLQWAHNSGPTGRRIYKFSICLRPEPMQATFYIKIVGPGSFG